MTFGPPQYELTNPVNGTYGYQPIHDLPTHVVKPFTNRLKASCDFTQARRCGSDVP